MKLWAVTTSTRYRKDAKVLATYETVQEASAHLVQLGKGHDLHILEDGELRWLTGDETYEYHQVRWGAAA